MTAPAAPSAVSLRGVSRRYGAVDAVAGVDLEIGEGEFFALLGPSGSGKTTMLMLIAGFDQPTGGDVLMAGTRMSEVPAHLRNIGVVFQSYALFPHMNVAENVAFPLRVRKLARAEREERVRAALALVKLSGKEGAFPGQLSGGQQQRVALARALVFGPRVLLMDEPLGALDRMLREEMQRELKSIQAALGVTVIYVTHDQSEAMAMADRIGVMAHGRLQQVADPQTLYARPANHFVAGFVGECSILRAEVEPDGTRLGVAGATVPAPPELPPGPRVDLVLRPENVALEPGGGAGLGGTIGFMTYLGATWRIGVALADGQTVLATLPGRAVAGRLAVGGTVQLHWPPDSGVALPPEARR
jgi:putative spermidine/putrescine transport system ATP-binding protein